MSTTIVFTNYSAKVMAHPQIMLGVPAQLAGVPGTATRVYKQVNADDVDFRFDDLAGQGVTVSEDGVLRAGFETSTDGAGFTPAVTSHVVTVETDADGVTLTLQAVAAVPVGFKMWIFMTVDGGGDLTVDGDGTETVLGTLTQVLADAGDVLEIESDGSNWIAHT